MIQPIIDKSYLVEVNLGTISAQKQIFFPFIPQLEGSIISCIQSYCSDGLLISPSGNTVVNAAGLLSLIVTFSVGDNQDIYNYPVSDFFSDNSYGFLRMINNKKLNLTKSYVAITSTSSLNNNEVILFNFYYSNNK